MVSKCANPRCSAPFLYLHSGKLFRVEERPSLTTASDTSAEANFGTKKAARRVEYFWLCEECAAEMTLVRKKGVGITTQKLSRAKGAAS